MSFLAMNSSALSISQAYLLANKAQAKLQKEAQKQDLNLRVLLCHAHLLDNVIGHLSSAKSSPSALYSHQHRHQHVKEEEPPRFSTLAFDDSDEEDDDNSDDGEFDYEQGYDDYIDNDNDRDENDSEGASCNNYYGERPLFKHSFPDSSANSARSSIHCNVAEVFGDDDDDDEGEDDDYLESSSFHVENEPLAKRPLLSAEEEDASARAQECMYESEESEESELSDNSDFSSYDESDDSNEEDIVSDVSYTPHSHHHHHHHHKHSGHKLGLECYNTHLAQEEVGLVKTSSHSADIEIGSHQSSRNALEDEIDITDLSIHTPPKSTESCTYQRSHGVAHSSVKAGVDEIPKSFVCAGLPEHASNVATESTVAAESNFHLIASN